MIRFKLLEHTDILPGVRKRKGATVMGLPKQRQIELVKEGKMEPVDYKGLPEGYPQRDMLVTHEYFSVEAVEAANDEELLAIDGIGPKRLKEIRTYNSKTKDNG